MLNSCNWDSRYDCYFTAFWKLVNFRNPSLSVFFHVLGPNEIISKSKPCLIRLDKLSTPRLVTCSGG